LNCTKAKKKLGWHEVWGIDTTVRKTVEWYQAYYDNQKILTHQDLNAYIQDAADKGLGWTK